jgi:hypothetical protein
MDWERTGIFIGVITGLWGTILSTVNTIINWQKGKTKMIVEAFPFENIIHLSVLNKGDSKVILESHGFLPFRKKPQFNFGNIKANLLPNTRYDYKEQLDNLMEMLPIMYGKHNIHGKVKVCAFIRDEIDNYYISKPFVLDIDKKQGVC